MSLDRIFTREYAPFLETSIAKVRKAIEVTQQVVCQEVTGNYWNKPGDPLSDYEVFFSWLERGRKSVITPYLRERKALGKTTYVLDVAGGRGQALRDLSSLGLLDGGINTSLTDMRSDEEKDFDSGHNIHLITGDLLRAKTWRDLQKAILEHTPRGEVDLAVVRPMGALRPKNIPLDIPIGVYHSILRRILEFVSTDNGMVLTQVPWNVHRKIISVYMRRLNEFPGLKVEFDPNYVQDFYGILYHRSDFDNGLFRIYQNAEEKFSIGSNNKSEKPPLKLS